MYGIIAAALMQLWMKKANLKLQMVLLQSLLKNQKPIGQVYLVGHVLG